MKSSFVRFSALAGVMSVLAIVSVTTVAQSKPAASQSTPATNAARAVPASAVQNYSKRTPWGHPDLQGLWTNTTTTPLQRPANFGSKATLTQSERAELDRQADRYRDAPPPPGNPGAYNDFWFERGRHNDQTSLVVDPANGRLPAKTLEGEAYQKKLDQSRYEDSGVPPDSWENFDVYDRCITRAMPGAMMPGFYNHNYRIVQTPSYVAIYVEMIHDVRMIPLDGRPHLPKSVHQWLGDSRGHWEGDTLVVETTNFKEGAQEVNKMANTVVGGSPDMVLVERFRRVDAETIDYRVTVTDPKVFTAPWTVSIPMGKLTEGDIYEYACHEGNYALGNMLRGSRAEEQKKRSTSAPK